MAAALFGCAMLRALARRTADIEEAEKMRENARELEGWAVDLLQRYASTNPRLTETILIRSVPIIGGRTLLHMARFAEALKFIAQPAVQQLIDHIWFGQVVESANTVPTMITAFFFPPAVAGLTFAAPGDRDLEKTKAQPLLHASV